MEQRTRPPSQSTRSSINRSWQPNLPHWWMGEKVSFEIFFIHRLFLIFRKIEKWTIKANETTQELIDLELDNYGWYPEIFLVNNDYCQS